MNGTPAFEPAPVVSRRRLLAIGTALGVLPALTALALAATGANPDDMQTMNALLELERAGIKAYDDVMATGMLSAGSTAVAMRFKHDHEVHRDALMAVLHGAGATMSENTAHLDYPPMHIERDVLQFARQVEEKAASTYLSIISGMHDPHLTELIGSILGAEASHVGALAQALGDPAYPGGFVA